jgi:hypothetical protein
MFPLLPWSDLVVSVLTVPHCVQGRIDVKMLLHREVQRYGINGTILHSPIRYMTRNNKHSRVVNLLLRIREVPGSNLGPETGYRDRGFSWVFLSLPRQIPRYYLKIRP